jgi:outer membrane receptor protein involved in Fe transport
VIQPVKVPGLVLSADYYSIRIEDAIAAVASQDIVNTCYDLPTYPNQFCDLFQRRVNPSDVSSPTFFGFRSLNQTQVNFGRLETSGVDFTASYSFSVKESNFALGFNGNWTQKLNRFFDPVQTDLVNPGLQELGAPKWAGMTTATWNLNRLTVGYRMQWIGRQAIASAIQIERLDEEFGPAGLAPNLFVHDLAFQFALTEQFMLSAGINNLFNEEPYLASSAYPVSGVGRFLFMSIDARF